MATGCKFLEKSNVMEAIYENTLGDEEEMELFNSFTDRLEAKKIPYLVYMQYEEHTIYKLELPLPEAYLFTPESKERMADHLITLKYRNPDSHIQSKSIEVEEEQPKTFSLRDRALRQSKETKPLLPNKPPTISLRDRAVKLKQ